MAFSEFEIHRYSKPVKQYVESHRPPPHIRKELDLAFRIENQSIEIYEIRPVRNDPNATVESSVVKTTYVQTTDTWKIFWKRADLKWHAYEPDPTADSIEDVLKIIEEDQLGCFYG